MELRLERALLRSAEVNIILKITDLTGTVYYLSTQLLNILEITRRKNILYSNPSHKLRLALVA